MIKKDNKNFNLIVAKALAPATGLNTHIFYTKSRMFLTDSNKNTSLSLGDLHHILIGIMLGDGSLYRSSPTSNVRFEMSLGQKYEEFAIELGILFKDYMNNPVKSLEVKGKTKSYTNYRLKTKSCYATNICRIL